MKSLCKHLNKRGAYIRSMKYHAIIRFLVMFIIIASLTISTGCTTKSQETRAITYSGPATQAVVPQDAARQGDTFNVVIQDMAYSPETLTIREGDTVVWKNEDTAPHTITSSLFDENIIEGAIFSYTFEHSGTYDYHCKIHLNMKGKIIVKK